MRSFASLCAVFALAAAAPAPIPQDIDFDLVDSLPNPTYSVATGATEQIVTYDPVAVLSAAQTQITSNVASAAITETSSVADLASLAKRSACAAQPTGALYAPTVTKDTPAAFTNNPAFASIALNATVPSGYVQRFSNLKASNNAYGYMGYTTLDSYDTNACAAKCNAINGCSSINIFFERDPSVNPGPGCMNPPSVTMIKCVFWGSPVNTGNAVNRGEWRQNFQVVIAGSNGYESAYATPPGYSAPVALSAAINAPYDMYGFNSYMGVALFNSGPFDLQLCADACTLKSQYARAHPPTDGSPVQTCQFFNTYILYVNNLTNPQGQYCAMYSESWNSTYATNTGQWRGSDYHFIGNSYALSNVNNPGAPNKNAAAHQASKDISYWTLQTYCASQYGLNVAPATATATITSYSTPTVTLTVSVTATITSAALSKRAGASSATSSSALPTNTVAGMLPVLAPAANGSAPQLTVSLSSNAVFSTSLADVHAVSKRAVATQSSSVSLPSVLTKYPSAIISSACALLPSGTAAGVITSTTTLTTGTAVPITSTTTTTVTVTSAAVVAVTPAAAYNSASASVSGSSSISSSVSAPVSNPVTTAAVPTSTPWSLTNGGQFLIQVTSGGDNTTGYYVGPDASNTASDMDLLSLVANETLASAFSLASDGTLLQVSSSGDGWIVQGASSGSSYSGIGAADGLFSNGEVVVCSVVSTSGRLMCDTPSNGHSVFGMCPQYTWIWLFGEVSDATAFCPDGTGALGLQIIPLE